ATRPSKRSVLKVDHHEIALTVSTSPQQNVEITQPEIVAARIEA
ncbi:25408_t:CDS:1, partial [Gigaspora margarita]